MINKIAVILALLISTSVISTQAYAEKEPQWYDVEIIFFRQLSSEGIDNENWSADILQPDTAECINISTEDLTGTTEFEPLPYSAIPRSELRLKAEASAIARSKSQRVLSHIGWRQPGYGKDKAVSIRIDAGPLLLIKKPPLEATDSMESGLIESKAVNIYATTFADNTNNPVDNTKPTSDTTTTETTTEPSPGVQKATVSPLSAQDLIKEIGIKIAEDEEPEYEPVIATAKLHGCVKIIRERYLHILTDMVYYHEDNEDLYADNEESYAFGKTINATSIPVISRRRMRSKEIHYLDNPGVGIVILVTPYTYTVKSQEEQEQ